MKQLMTETSDETRAAEAPSATSLVNLLFLFRNRIAISLFLVVFLFTLVGCRHLQTSQWDHRSESESTIRVFQKRHPDLARSYSFLREANIGRYFDLLRVEVANEVLIMKWLKEKFGGQAEIVEFADRVTSGETKRLREVRKDILKLTNAAKQGTLCEFEYQKDGKNEWGFLVLHDGEIVLRQVWSNSALELETAESLDN